MSRSADAAWQALDAAWQAAFDEAWCSWSDGNFGIGAVLADPAQPDANGSPTLLSRGRNRVAERASVPGLIAGNFMAHAEMNAFNALPRFNAVGLHLYTTLEPCLMCAATSILLNVSHVHFAAEDSFFDGLDDLWPRHPYTAQRQPTRSQPIGGRLRSFASVLPLSFTIALRSPEHPVLVRAREHDPNVAALAATLASNEALLAVRGEPTVEALRILWNDLPEDRAQP